MRTDPVCGATIDPLRARAVVIVKGERYYFCSLEHRDQFNANPSRFLAASASLPVAAEATPVPIPTPTPTPVPSPTESGSESGSAPAPDPGSALTPAEEGRYAPLDIGADYLTYRRVTDEPFLSRVHGNRWVHVYVSEEGADEYLDGNSDIPVGTTVVKASWENDNGKPSAVEGPIYVMRKQPPGWWPEHEDWYYAIHWAKPTPEQAEKLGGPIYWRGHSPKAAYCYECHDDYYRSLGGLTPSSVIPR